MAKMSSKRLRKPSATAIAALLSVPDHDQVDEVPQKPNPKKQRANHATKGAQPTKAFVKGGRGERGKKERERNRDRERERDKSLRWEPC